MKKQELKTAACRSYEISLSKLTGVAIEDIHGYVSHQFGGATFKLTRLILVDGTDLDFEGEHDMPYLAYDDATEKRLRLDEDSLESIEE